MLLLPKKNEKKKEYTCFIHARTKFHTTEVPNQIDTTTESEKKKKLDNFADMHS